jgi:MFS family permease
MEHLMRPLAAASGAVVAGVLPMFLTAGLALRIDADVAFGEVSLGVAVAAFHVVSAVTAPGAGRLVERIGPARALRLSGALAIAATAGIAAAGRSATTLIALLAIAGAANGASGPGASALLAQAVPVRRRGLAFGAQQAGAPLAALLAGLGLAGVAAALGWRWAFVLAALVGAAAVAVVPPAAARPAPSGGMRSATAPRGGNRELRLLAVAAALASATSTGMMAFLVVFASHAGMPEATAGALLVLVSATAMLSRIGLGLSVDRWGGDALAIAARLLCASAAGCVALATGEPALIVLGALAAGGLGWAWTGLFTLAVVKRHPAAPGRAVGVMMSGLFAGAAGGPLLVGAFAYHDAYAPAWIACSALALLAAGCLALARGGGLGATSS